MQMLREVGTFSLKHVKYIVFYEADRLFEMAFADQLHEIIRECPAERQVGGRMNGRYYRHHRRRHSLTISRRSICLHPLSSFPPKKSLSVSGKLPARI